MLAPKSVTSGASPALYCLVIFVLNLSSGRMLRTSSTLMSRPASFMAASNARRIFATASALGCWYSNMVRVTCSSPPPASPHADMPAAVVTKVVSAASNRRRPIGRPHPLTQGRRPIRFLPIDDQVAVPGAGHYSYALLVPTERVDSLCGVVLVVHPRKARVERARRESSRGTGRRVVRWHGPGTRVRPDAHGHKRVNGLRFLQPDPGGPT